MKWRVKTEDNKGDLVDIKLEQVPREKGSGRCMDKRVLRNKRASKTRETRGKGTVFHANRSLKRGPFTFLPFVTNENVSCGDDTAATLVL